MARKAARAAGTRTAAPDQAQYNPDHQDAARSLLVLAQLAEDPSTPPGARVAAARAVLEARGWLGSRSKHTGNGQPKSPGELTAQELDRYLVPNQGDPTDPFA